MLVYPTIQVKKIPCYEKITKLLRYIGLYYIFEINMRLIELFIEIGRQYKFSSDAISQSLGN